VSQVILIGEKWNKGPTDVNSTEVWMEFTDGDGNEDPAHPGEMLRFADRHAGAMNATFFDGHAHRETPSQIWPSVWLTGCILTHRFPTTRACDTSFPGCTRTGATNLCNKWATSNPYPDN
jgi:prepilin-type processing-associated H-X9-DG protein